VIKRNVNLDVTVNWYNHIIMWYIFWSS